MKLPCRSYKLALVNVVGLLNAVELALAGLNIDLAVLPVKTRLPIKDPIKLISDNAASANNLISNDDIKSRDVINRVMDIPVLEASLPKLPVPSIRPCSCDATIRSTPSPLKVVGAASKNRLALEPSIRGMQAGHPRGSPPRSAVKPIPGKGVHCSLTMQHTSGLDCPCNTFGERCGPPRSICANFSSEYSTCMCNLAESIREGTKCQPAAVAVPARGMDFRIFAPAPVVEVGCDVEPCQMISGINTLMGVTPYSWTITRIHSTGTDTAIPDDVNSPPDISLDENASILNGANCLRSARGLSVDLDKVSAHHNQLPQLERTKEFFTGRQMPIGSGLNKFEKLSKVDVYRIVARDGEGTVSNMVTLTVFFNNQCRLKTRKSVIKDV